MALRSDLHVILETLLGSDNVYFQSPPSLQMKYPCIVYKETKPQVKHAGNIAYFTMNLYEITVIDRDPDSQIPGKISKLTYASFVNKFPISDLNHTIYNLYF